MVLVHFISVLFASLAVSFYDSYKADCKDVDYDERICVLSYLGVTFFVVVIYPITWLCIISDIWKGKYIRPMFYLLLIMFVSIF